MSLSPPVLDTIDTYRMRFHDAEYWRPFVQIVVDRHNLNTCQRVRSHNPGTYPTFIVDDRFVVKFFGSLFRGAETYAVELEANRLIAKNDRIPSPQLLAQGTLFDHASGWPWPYLVFAYHTGISLGDIYEQIDIEDKLDIAHQLAPIIRCIHELPVRNTQRLAPNGDSYRVMLQHNIISCTARHQDWNTLPGYLTNQIKDYLPPLDQLVAFHSPPVLLHADITADHILCSCEDGHWSVCGLIDFGDAAVADPAYDLLSLHLDAFRCDRRLLAAFLNGYKWDAQMYPISPQKMLALALCHQYDVLNGVLRFQPQAMQSTTLHELAHYLFDSVTST